MAGFWPLYSNFVTKSQVTLALPGKPSNISKSVGGNFPALLLVPNVDFLVAFIKGNIGIADAMTKAAMVKNLNSPIAANDEMVARHFSKVNKLGLEDNMDKLMAFPRVAGIMRKNLERKDKVKMANYRKLANRLIK